MSTITFIPQIAKIKLQGIAKSRKQKLTNLINEALKEYLEKEDLKIVQKQTKATIAYQGRMNKLFEKIKIPQDLRTKDVDELLTEEIVKKKLTYGNCLFRYKYSIKNLINKKFQKKFLDLSQNYDIVIYEVVLFELANLTKKYFGAKIASKIITGLIESYKIYQQNLDDLKQALGIMEKYDFNKPNKDYTLEDCIQLYCVQKEAAIMISLDEEMGFFKFKTGEFLHIQK